MNVSIVMTAARHGAHVLNHAAVVDLVKDASGRVRGAMVEDRLTGKKWLLVFKVFLHL